MSNFEFGISISPGGCFRKQGEKGWGRLAQGGGGQAASCFQQVANRRKRGAGGEMIGLAA